MKPHAIADIIGAFTNVSTHSDFASDERPNAESTPSPDGKSTIQGATTLRWAQIKDGAPQGQRHTAAAVMAGKLLSDLSQSLWTTAYWPAMVAWNRKNDPPLPDSELKQVAGGILKIEQAKLALAKQERKEKSEKGREEDPSLIDLITEKNCQPFHDQHSDPHAHVLVNDHWETMRINSRPMKRWLSMLSWRAAIVSNKEQIGAAILNLEARAVHDGPKLSLETRVTYLKDEYTILYDLADPLWRAVKITPAGYSIVPSPGIHFRRFAHQEQQVYPIDGGDLCELLTLTNLANADQELLFLVHLVSCLIPFIPHTIPNFHGPQGSAKTTLAKMERALVDPSSMSVLSFPDNARELVQILSHHYMAVFDNVSKITQEMSDIICRAVTGEGTSRRQLYTDDEDFIYTFRRCVGFTGINPTASKPDLLDRSILIGLERIPEEKRREERLVLEDFEAMRPRLVGAMFTTLSKAMAIYPEIQLERLPRMVDFCRWGCAIALALGYTQEEFVRVYFANIKEQHEEAIQADQLSTAIQIFIQKNPKGWTGKASELLEELETVAMEEKLNIASKDWPKRANTLSRRLNEIKTNLLEVGIVIGSGGARIITLSQVGQNIATTDIPSQPEDSSVDTVQAAMNIFDVSPGNMTAPDSIVMPSSSQHAASTSQDDDSDDDNDHPETSEN